jgi:PAS domain S-box-containing protein
LNYVDIYQFNEKRELIKSLKTGNMRPISSRDQLDPKILFILKGDYGKEYTIYFRIKNDASMTLSLSLNSISQYMKSNSSKEILLGLFIGIMLLIVGYNIFLNISLKDLSYLYFSISVLSLAGYMISIKGYAYLYLWPDMAVWNKISIPLFVSVTEIFFLKYMSEFFQLKEYTSKISILFNILITLIIISFLGSVFISYHFFILIINALVALIIMLLIIIGIVLWHRNIFRSMYFQSSLFVLSIGVLMVVLVRVGVLPSDTITENGIIFTTLFFVIFMSLALADRVNFYKSRQQLAALALYENEERLRALVETSNDIIWEINSARKVVYINPRVKDILGFEPQEILGKDVFAVIIPIYPDIIKKTMQESINTGNPIIGLEYIVTDKNGKKVILEKNATPVYDENGSYSGFKSIDRDITERRKYEKALQESEERFRIIVENSPVGIIIGGTPFTFKYVNPKFIEMTGYSKEELLTYDISMLLDNETMELVVDRYKRRLNGENVPSLYEIEYKRKDGEIRIAEMRVSVGKNSDGTSMVITQILDVTDNKHLQQQLIQSQKMEAIGTLAGGIAHDFNNLLTVIKGYADICLMQTDKNDKNYKQISAIRIAGEKAESLTKQILAFSKKQEHLPKIVEINHLLKELQPLTQRLVGKRIKIEMNLKENLPEIIADPAQIEQIIINMMVNARDAINNIADENKIKQITIETDEALLDDYSSDGLERKHIIISISDTGTGMSKKIQDKIFDPFYTTKEAGKGTGLGLATVYGILSQNNATIDVFSEVGKGTIFKIYWPAATDDIS